MDIKERRLLIVDDEKTLRESLKTYLKEHGFREIILAENKAQGLYFFHQQEVDLVILDIMLPDGNGFEIMDEIRKFSHVPILFLTALDGEEEKNHGFMGGGDDYIVKPFSPSELLLRVIAILRRTYGFKEVGLAQLKAAVIDFERGMIIREGKEYAMTATEYRILQLLYENVDKIVTIDGLLNHIWGEENFGYEKTLITHMWRIREKIESTPARPQTLLTIKGLGYKLVRS